MNNSTPIRIGIVEDEALIADHLAQSLEDLGYQIAFIADEAAETLDLLQADNTIDLLLLDINIHGALDGIDLANQVNRLYSIPLIFISSNTDAKTLERVRYTRPAGFIVKPYTLKDLETTIGIALFNYYDGEIGNEKSESPSSVNSSFFLKDKHAFVRLDFGDILYVEALDNYSVIHTGSGKHIVSQTLKSVEQKFSGNNFMRIHRSFLVNLEKIEKIEPKSVTISGKEIPLSESNKSELLQRVNLF